MAIIDRVISLVSNYLWWNIAIVIAPLWGIFMALSVISAVLKLLVDIFLFLITLLYDNCKCVMHGFKCGSFLYTCLGDVLCFHWRVDKSCSLNNSNTFHFHFKIKKKVFFHSFKMWPLLIILIEVKIFKV